MRKCDYCYKPIGEAGKIYIAGTICQGHQLPLIKWLLWKVLKFKL